MMGQGDSFPHTRGLGGAAARGRLARGLGFAEARNRCGPRPSPRGGP